MKIAPVCLMVAILCFAAISARADGIPDDGRIIVGLVLLIAADWISRYT